MDKICNIVSIDGLIEEKLPYIDLVSCYKFNNNLLNEINLTIPTLFIGYYETLLLYPRIKILDKKINDNIWWCLNKEQDLINYFEELRHFEEKIINYYDNKVSYIHLNLIQYTKEECIKLLENCNNYKTFENNRSIYVFNQVESIIVCIDKQHFNYIDNDLLIRIKDICKVKTISIRDDKLLSRFIKMFPSSDEIIERMIVMFL